MKIAHRFSISTAALLIGLGAMPALAQEAGSNTVVTNPSAAPANTAPTTNSPNTTVDNSRVTSVVNGDVSAENNIEQGLKSGQLTPEEAARLEAHQSKIDQIESQDLGNGRLSTNEQNRIDNAELKEGSRIVALDNNGVTANPDSKASARLAADVQRDVNQEDRILRDSNNGNLTNTQVGALEGGQARVDGMEGKAGSNDAISSGEQNRIRTAENGQSANIYDDAHGNVTGLSNGDQGRNDAQHMRTNRVYANNDGSLSYADPHGKGDKDDDRDRMNDRDNSNGSSNVRDFDRDNHHDDFDRFSDNHDRDDRFKTAQNGDTGQQDRDNRFQFPNGNQNMDGDHDQMMNQPSSQSASSNDSTAMNTNSNTSTGTNANNSVSGTLNGQSVTANNATTATSGTSGASVGTHTAVTTPHITPHPVVAHHH